MGIPLSLVRMKVPEISFYVKADFSEWTKSQHYLLFLFPTIFKTDKLLANGCTPPLSNFTVMIGVKRLKRV